MWNVCTKVESKMADRLSLKHTQKGCHCLESLVSEVTILCVEWDVKL